MAHRIVASEVSSILGVASPDLSGLDVGYVSTHRQPLTRRGWRRSPAADAVRGMGGLGHTWTDFNLAGSLTLAMNPNALTTRTPALPQHQSAQKWSDVQALELPEADRAVLRGRRPEEAHANGPPIPIIVVPCTLSETLSITWLSTIFRSISTLAAPDDEAAGTGGDVTELLLPPPPQQRSGSPHRLQTEYLFLGITSPDGSQVYYKLSNGIVKPPL